MKFFVYISLLCSTALPLAAQTVPLSQAQLYYSFSPIVKKAAPAVVNIYTKKRVVAVSPLMADPFFQQFFGGQPGMTQERVQSSLGSGVLIKPAGEVVTSYHVVDGASDIVVVLQDGSEYSARLTRTDPELDLALLTLQQVKSPLPSLPLRAGSEPEVGDLVLAIGNPFGVGQTVTSGIVSALARPVNAGRTRQLFLQTDAAINPGNSGGALVDMQGQLVGINTAIFSKSGGSHGIGFAIPAQAVKSFLSRSTLQSGQVVKPWFGAELEPLNTKAAAALGLPQRAIIVRDVYPDSPADDGGLIAGDVITALNATPLTSLDTLHYAVETGEEGAVLALEVLRKGAPREITVTLALPPDAPPRDARTLRGAHPLAGAQVANLNPAVASELGIPLAMRGVVVMNQTQFLRQGDLIDQVNGTAISSTAQLVSLLTKPAARYAIRLLRGGRVLNLVMQ